MNLDFSITVQKDNCSKRVTATAVDELSGMELIGAEADPATYAAWQNAELGSDDRLVKKIATYRSAVNNLLDAVESAMGNADYIIRCGQFAMQFQDDITENVLEVQELVGSLN